MHEDARRQLAKRLGHDPNPAAWAYLVKKLIVEQYEQDVAAVGPEVALNDLEQEYRDFVEAAELGRSKAPASYTEPPDARYKALSEIVALDAARRGDVKAFRREVLRDHLMTLEEAVKWIEDEAKRQQGTHLWSKVPIPLDAIPVARPMFKKGTDPWAWLAVAAAAPPEEKRRWGYPSLNSDTLDYAGPEDEYVRMVPVVFGSPLHRLERLSGRLADAYGWQKVQATMFVLTGIPPAISLARVTTRQGNRFGALDTVTLRIPVGVPVKKVMEIYSRARQEMIGRGRRDPAITNQKTADLAVFIAKHNDGRTWREAMEAWNAEYGQDPKRRYDNPRLFSRDARNAYQRITGTRLFWGDPEAQNLDANFRAMEGIARVAKEASEDAKGEKGSR